MLCNFKRHLLRIGRCWGRCTVPFGHASLNVCSAHDPRCARTGLRRRQLFQPNQPQDRGLCDPENLTGFADEHFAASLPFSLTVDRNLMMVAHEPHTLRCPYFAKCRAALVAIQDGGETLVRFDPRQHANYLHLVLVRNIAIFPSTNLLNLYPSMIPSLPMQHEP